MIHYNYYHHPYHNHHYYYHHHNHHNRYHHYHHYYYYHHHRHHHCYYYPYNDKRHYCNIQCYFHCQDYCNKIIIIVNIRSSIKLFIGSLQSHIISFSLNVFVASHLNIATGLKLLLIFSNVPFSKFFFEIPTSPDDKQ